MVLINIVIHNNKFPNTSWNHLVRMYSLFLIKFQTIDQKFMIPNDRPLCLRIPNKQ